MNSALSLCLCFLTNLFPPPCVSLVVPERNTPRSPLFPFLAISFHSSIASPLQHFHYYGLFCVHVRVFGSLILQYKVAGLPNRAHAHDSSSLLDFFLEDPFGETASVIVIFILSWLIKLVSHTSIPTSLEAIQVTCGPRTNHLHVPKLHLGYLNVGMEYLNFDFKYFAPLLEILNMYFDRVSKYQTCISTGCWRHRWSEFFGQNLEGDQTSYIYIYIFIYLFI